MSSHFNRDLNKLKEKVLGFYMRIEKAFLSSMEAFESRDPTLANKVVKGDENIDRIELEIEEECLKILALNQPVAMQLRLLIGFLKMTNDLERIADMCANIAKSCLSIEKREQDESFAVPYNVEAMQKLAFDMMQKGYHSLDQLNTDLAREVLAKDSALDKMHKENYYALAEHAAKNTPKQNPEAFMFMCFVSFNVSKQLERIGDLTTNIAESVLYIVEGDIVRHQNV